MISRTRSSGSAYSCSPRSKLTSDTLRLRLGARPDDVAAETDDLCAAREPETPSRVNSSRSSRRGFNILIVLSPSAPLITPSRSVRIDGPAPASSFSSCSRGKRQQAIDPIDDKCRPAHRDRSR